MEVADSFGAIYATVFDEAGERILGSKGKVYPCNLAKELNDNDFEDKVKDSHYL